MNANRLVISCHADTNFKAQSLSIDTNGDYYGHLDNFLGVYTVMQAYFSGELARDDVRIELTYGEEDDMAGAYEVMETLTKNDLIIVIDVTGVPTDKDFLIVKCDDPDLAEFIDDTIGELSYEIYEDDPDPVAQGDESDVYKERFDKVICLGIPVRDGDYNKEEVAASPSSVEAVVEALVRFAEAIRG